MKYSLTLATIIAIAGAIYSQAEDVLPPQYNFDRYSKMMDQSPFAIATAVAAPAATPDFAKDLYIANAAQVAGRRSGNACFDHGSRLQKVSYYKGICGRLQHCQHRMVRQSRSDEGDDQQGRKFCDAYLQSSATVASVARRSCRRQSAACSCDAESRRHAKYACTKIAPQHSAGITTVNSFARVDAAAFTWHDSAEPKNDEGIGAGRE